MKDHLIDALMLFSIFGIRIIAGIGVVVIGVLILLCYLVEGILAIFHPFGRRVY